MLTTAVAPLRARWAAASLAAQFALTSAIVVSTGMALLGWWVSGRIERGVVAHGAASAAMHMDIFIEPKLQELGRSEPLSAESKKALTELVSVTDLGQKIADVKIWDRAGRQIFSTVPEASGATVVNAIGLNALKVHAAWEGSIQSSYESMGKTSDRAGV